VERVGRHDHFFELGGHSLLAVQLMAKMQRAFGVSIALRDLFTHRTLNELSTAISNVMNYSDPTPAYNNLIPIRPTGTELPLFLIHPGGGGVDYVRNLAPYIDTAVPIYGLEATGLQPGQQPLETIEEIAASYVYWIRQAQGRGPYRLGGWSLGGIIAFEISRQLAEVGESVAFVGFIDTYWRQSTDASYQKAPNELDEKSALVDLLLPYCDERTFGRVRELAASFDFDELLGHLNEMRLIPEEFQSMASLDASMVRRIIITRYANNRAVSNYSPLKADVPIWLFQGRDNPSIPATETWEIFTETTHAVSVLGSHMTMTVGEENLKYLGTAISSALASSRHE